MTSPTRRRTATRRRRKLNKRGKFLFGMLAAIICFTIWNAVHREDEEAEPSQEAAAVSDTGQKQADQKKNKAKKQRNKSKQWTAIQKSAVI